MLAVLSLFLLVTCFQAWLLELNTKLFDQSDHDLDD